MQAKRARGFGIAWAFGLAAVATAILSATFVSSAIRPAVARSDHLKHGVTTTTGPSPRIPVGANPTTFSAMAAEDAGVEPMSVSGSSVTTQQCYEPGVSRSYCFTARNGSTDNEWLDQVRLTFPDFGGLGPWTASCLSQDPADSSGSPVSFACSITPPLNHEVVYTDSDSDGYGEVTAGSSWGFCVNLAIPASYDGPRILNWGLSGEGGGAPPHDISGELTIEQCTPLMLTPASLIVEGCNGITQTHLFELANNTGSAGTFSLEYNVPSGNATFAGPDSLVLADSQVATFSVELKPGFFLQAGEQVTATLQASGNGHGDSSTVVETIATFAGWEMRASSPIPTMDNAVVWASHQDGGLWSVGGYGANGAAQRYDLASHSWTTHSQEISPVIAYPMDGCYGLDGEGHEVIVLFPDTIVTGTLHRYDITDDTWDALPVPAGFPSGRWAQDIVSLLNVTGENVCYISGGATTTGGGNVNNLWEYRPDTNISIYLNNFTHHPSGFDFHASWFVPWVGSSGAVCVGGGIDRNSGVVADSQCYDLATGTFNPPNADLGPLPEPWWGMADGWMMYQGRYQIWIANGVSQNGALLPASAYADETTGGFVYGPAPSIGLYRLEGDGGGDQFYVGQGAAGWFNATRHSQSLGPCPECRKVYLPLTLRNFP